MGGCGKEVLLQCHHVYIRGATHDMHRLALLIQVSKSRVLGHFFFKKKPSYPMQSCPAKVFAWLTQIRTRIRVCQRIMKTPARLLTGLGKSRKANVCGNFLKRKMRLGKTLFPPSDFKNKSFETFILWEIAARKLDFAASEQQGHRSDCDDVKTSVFVC